MDLHLRRNLQLFAAALLTIALVSFIGAWSMAISLPLMILAIPVMLLVVATCTLVLLVQGIIIGLTEQSLRDRLIKFGTTPVLLAISIMLAWPALYGGSLLGTHVRLLINLTSYRQIIAEARTGALEPGIYHTSENGIDYIVDNGPPVRVAFNPDGLLDNWSGIIFDPTGIVMSAKGFHPVTGAFYAPERVTKLFGGDLVSCHSLWGDFYHCSFT